jgi:hypothetical protein
MPTFNTAVERLSKVLDDEAGALAGTKQSRQNSEQVLPLCGGIGHEFRIWPYLMEAKFLQDMGQEKAVERLRLLAKGDKRGRKVVSLCRMLFEKKKGGEFRRPSIGGAHFLGGSSYGDWPLEPIAIYKGIPILIATGYSLGGFPESNQQYLEYCVTNCQWAPVKFTEQGEGKVPEQIADFIKTVVWKRPLRSDEERFLMNQAEQPAGGDGNPAPQP